MVPLYWRRLFRAVRVMLGLSFVAAALLPFEQTISGIGIVFIAYSVFATAALLWRNFEVRGHGMLALSIDTAALLASLVWMPPYFSWLSIFLCLFVMVSAAIDHPWWMPAVIASFGIVAINFASPPAYSILLAALALTGFLGSVVAAEREMRLMEHNRQSTERLKQARYADQQRIAADFHDGPMQISISLQLRLEIVRKLLLKDRGEAEQELLRVQELANSQVQELRSFIRDMRPVMADANLNASFRKTIDDFQRDSGIPVSFITVDVADPPKPEVAVELMQIVREALANVRRHSGATRVAIGMNKMDDAIELSVEDNGDGFPFVGKFTLDELERLRLGPATIKRRVRALGGELVLESKPGLGSGLRVRLPT